jgi:hypothetical protein
MENNFLLKIVGLVYFFIVHLHYEYGKTCKNKPIKRRQGIGKLMGHFQGISTSKPQKKPLTSFLLC